MNNLMPEKRLDRVGRLVTRWVKHDTTSTKNSILGTILPTIPDATSQYLKEAAASDKVRHADLLRELRTAIEKDAYNHYSIAGKTGQAKGNALHLMQDRLDKITRIMEKMDTETLQVLINTPCAKYLLVPHLQLPGEVSEVQFRERMHYMVVDADGTPSLFNARFFDKVRDALNTDDLSAYPRGNTEHEVISSTLRLLHQDWNRRSTKMRIAPEDKVEDDYLRHLLEFLMEQPEKATRIKDFLIERNACLDEIDITLIEDYLNTPTPALGEGLL